MVTIVTMILGALLALLWDETGMLIERLARRSPQETAVHVTHLPPGWLGKTHALALGAADATSE